MSVSDYWFFNSMSAVIDFNDKDLLELLYSTLLAKFDEAQGRRDTAESEMQEIFLKIERVETKLNSLKVIAPPDLTLSGRVKKGDSERLIKLFLQTKNGAGASMKDVMQAAHTKYGTTRRVLKVFIDSGSVIESNGLFKWSVKSLSEAKVNGEAAPSKGDAGPTLKLLAEQR